MLHQLICSQEQIDLTVDGIVYKPQKSDHSGHFLLCCDWPLVPKHRIMIVTEGPLRGATRANFFRARVGPPSS